MSHSRTAASPRKSILTWRSRSRLDLPENLARTPPRSARVRFLTPTDFLAVYKARLDNGLARAMKRNLHDEPKVSLPFPPRSPHDHTAMEPFPSPSPSPMDPQPPAPYTHPDQREASLARASAIASACP